MTPNDPRLEETVALVDELQRKLNQHVKALKVAKEAMKDAVIDIAISTPKLSVERVHAILSSALGDIEMLVPSEKEGG